ncbi:MAG: glycoside hydrolase family 2 [Dysgonamonadaceae bacterium]|jgi:beta-galactosidase|nr:glycoside hydrolase family 2 [Dysgonamonadaceae bacterium]
MYKKRIYIALCCLFATFYLSKARDYQPEFSVAGFYPLENAGREVFNFNVGWRFKTGNIENAEKTEFDDSGWEVVSTPHTVRLMPAEGSGSRNYQGQAWYRKHFKTDASLQGKLIHIYFEAAMGKSEVYLNGKKVAEHLGGYLPFCVELTQHGVQAGDECLLAVMTDNSDDKAYPPGKKQATLDFAYHGGIYRDVWMIATPQVHLTDPNQTDRIAGGGIYIRFGEISKKKAEVRIYTDVTNAAKITQSILVENRLINAEGKTLKIVQTAVRLKAGENRQVAQKIIVDNPALWYPDSPCLYKIATLLFRPNKTALDGGITRIGIRKIEWKGTDGLWLNGEPFGKLIGGNRHQDYAYVGNAVPNSQHWRDAKKLRDAGCRIIRVAHYPQDPSFMDACDELGMFVIVATPGWQYWNSDPQFAERAYDDIRNMVRRDRNHPSVLMWEPILNETRWPAEFARKAQQIVHEEYQDGVCVADNYSDGIAENYEAVYGWPKDIGRFKQPIFTREFAENVDDWYAQNTNNRASRNWGEHALLLQALHHAKAYNEMYPESRQFIGGALWHPFDHQRGYHPDPYWGGIMDAFRQPKYSWYLFKSQIDADVHHPLAETGPMVFIAHELSPFSSPDITVFTNCDEVRLIVYERDTLVEKAPKAQWQLPHPPITFKNVFEFNSMRILPYTEKKWQQVSLVAEGLIGGKVVCRTKKMPARRSNKLRLSVDNEGQKLTADGSDFIPVICEVVDDDGNVRRLAKEQIRFDVEGEGEIIGDAQIGANPRAVEFGSAPVLIRSTLTPGKIRVHARVLFEGENVPSPASIEWESIPSRYRFVYSEKPQWADYGQDKPSYQRKLSEEEKRKMLNEVELQQTDFGEKK